MTRLFTLIFLLLAGNAFGEGFSYLYIQGDKVTPIYVKVEDKMLPRYGKNYAIIPQLAAGETHISILFQLNAFPEQHFTLLAPDGGSRSFLLINKDGNFSLYDLQQKFYIPAGNGVEEDHLDGDEFLVKNIDVPAANIETPRAKVETPAKETFVIENVANPITETPATKAEEDDGQPKFIEGIELNNRHDGSNETIPLTQINGDENEEEPTRTTTTTTTTSISNSDCQGAISNEDFSKLYKDALARSSDEDRYELLSSKTGDCYATWQARTLVGLFKMDATKFLLLKTFYPHITDQSEYKLLDDTLTDPTWKAEFQKLINRR